MLNAWLSLDFNHSGKCFTTRVIVTIFLSKYREIPGITCLMMVSGAYSNSYSLHLNPRRMHHINKNIWVWCCQSGMLFFHHLSRYHIYMYIYIYICPPVSVSANLSCLYYISVDTLSVHYSTAARFQQFSISEKSDCFKKNFSAVKNGCCCLCMVAWSAIRVYRVSFQTIYIYTLTI